VFGIIFLILIAPEAAVRNLKWNYQRRSWPMAAPLAGTTLIFLFQQTHSDFGEVKNVEKNIPDTSVPSQG
jgi:hypothetical protein